MPEQLTPRDEFEAHFGRWEITNNDWRWIQEFIARHYQRTIIDWDRVEAFRITLSSGEKFTYPPEQVEVVHKQYEKSVEDVERDDVQRAGGYPEIDPWDPYVRAERFYKPGETHEDSIRRIVRSVLEDEGLIEDAFAAGTKGSRRWSERELRVLVRSMLIANGLISEEGD